MTETREDGSYLVRVRAQVMSRDDSSGGWVPLSGGGLANVSVRRRLTSGGSSTNVNLQVVPAANQNHSSTSTSPPDTSKRKHEYLILGKRMTDQSMVLSCTIKQDFEYNRVMPTFHHWRTGDKRFGLTFQTTADARAFAHGVGTAVQELSEGFTGSTQYNDPDDDVFMTLNLPVEPPESRPSSETHCTLRSYRPQCVDFPDSQKPIHYISGSTAKPTIPSMHYLLDPTTDATTENYPYVQLTTLNHEYLYPVIENHKKGKDGNNAIGSLKKPEIVDSQPTKKTEYRNLRLRCKHCHELYNEQQNSRGSCEYAPDCVKQGIDTASCIACAQCMLYHCVSDSDGDFPQNPCSCSAEEGCGRRWFGLALLSLIVPCLCVYPPLKGVYWCGTSCGLCGGKHHPME